MSVVVITPTADQPTGLRLLDRYLQRQTVQPDAWLIVDDGTQHADTPDWPGVYHYRRARTDDGPRSLGGNILAACSALESMTGIETVVICEHDDWYAPDHIETCLQRLADHPQALATGSQWQRYYHVPTRRYRVMRNIGSALCNTAIRYGALPLLRRAAEAAYQRNSKGLDRLLWESIPRQQWDVHDTDTVVGIKGLPGRVGLGIGHRPDHRWTADSDFVKLREWIGDDAETYAKYAHFSDGLSNSPVKYSENA